VASCGILVVNVGFSFLVFMSLIVIAILDRLLWLFELTNINGSRISELLNIGSETLKHIGQVVLLLNSRSELVNLILTFSCGGLISLGLLLFLVKALLVTFFVAFHFLLILLFALSSALNLRVVQQPLRKEVNGVLRVSPVHDSHTL